jgi:hypothetical protein
MYWTGGTNGITKADVQGPVNAYFVAEERWQNNSASNLFDGLEWYCVNNKEVGHLPVHQQGSDMKWKLRQTDGVGGECHLFCIAQGVEGTELMFIGTSNAYWVDYAYMDNSWARVCVGNASTWSAVTDYYPLPPSAWSDTQITVAELMKKSGWYVYIFDSSGNLVNASGVQVP